MARLRQQFPQNYGSSGNINTEFESVVRYLNSAELGNNTLGELLGKIFDDNGSWSGPVEFRRDTTNGIQYRVGEYNSPEEGWVTLVNISDLRGEAGASVGEIGAPIIFGRVDFIAASEQTDFEYAFSETDELLVYVSGVLQTEGAAFDYSKDPSAGSAGLITFSLPFNGGEVVTVFKIRSTSITGFTRSDTFTTATQINFPFSFDENTKLQVYKNGILQREGGSNDYTLIPDQNTVQFNSAVPSGNLVSIITVENTSVQAVTGMMFEENFTNQQTGLIRFSKIEVSDEEIPQSKIFDLVDGLGEKAKLTVSSNSPSNPQTGDLWHDISQTPNQLKFYDGTQWLRTSPDSSLPTFVTSNAGQFVKVNGTGTALEYGTVDFSSVIPITQKGSANGVASLDSTGRLPSSQLPSVLSSDSIYFEVELPANQPYRIKRIYKQKIRIDGIAFQTTSGTCSVQITVNGVGLGNVYSVSSTPNEFTLGTPIEIDASTTSNEIGFEVTNNASAFVLEVTMAISVIAS